MKKFGKIVFILLVLAIYSCLSVFKVESAIAGKASAMQDRMQRNHIVHHLASLIGKDSAEEMDDRRFRFYFFKFHDENNDKLLDGCELVKSVIHFYDEMKTDDNHSEEFHSTDVYPDDMLARAVDSILEAHDKNNDGFLDYLEFTINAPLVLKE